MRFTQSQFVTLWAILELKKKSLCNMQKSGSTLLSVRNCQINREKFIKFMFSKGQIISECPYEIIVYPKIATKKFPRFLPWPLRRGQIKKIKALYYTN